MPEFFVNMTAEAAPLADRALDAIKGFLVAKLGGLPVLGDFIADAPTWVFAVIGVVAIVSSLGVVFGFIAHMRERLGQKMRGSKIGAVREKRRVLSQAAKEARRKNYGFAAELYLGQDEPQLAAETLEEGGLYAKAGQLYERLGHQNKAIELYEKAGEYAWLAEAYKKKGDNARAGDIYLKLGKKLLAAESFAKGEKHMKAAGLYEEAGHTTTAAELYEKAGEYRKAAGLFERAYVEGASSQEGGGGRDRQKKLNEFSIKAGTYFEKVGDFAKASEAFARSKAFPQAGEAAFKAGDKNKAADYLRMGKQYERAAEIYRADGNTHRACEVMAEKYMADGNDLMAGRMYLDAEDFVKAAELFDRIGEYGMAAEAYADSQEFANAAEMYIKGDDKAKAAESYAKAGMPKQAARLYIELGDTDKASSLIEESGDYVLAAELYRKTGQADKELAALQKVAPDDPRFTSSVISLAEIFKSRGNLKLAADKYVQAIAGIEPDQSNLELFYGLGRVYEDDSRYDEAAKAYQKVQLVDFSYEDAGERLKKCIELASQSKREASSTGTARSGSGTDDASKRYAIMQEVGRGGMGVVYKAKDNNLNRVIALKLLPKSISDNPKVIQRFAAEARSAAQLNHANIVTLYDFQQAGGRSFITMEFVEGVTLKKLMGMVDRLPLVKALKIIYQCCQGLDYAHKKGIIHRDIKPSNIMINKQNIVKIMDFGLAKMAGEETITERGSISGTVMYMSPEQLLGKPLDRTTDIYSLGLVFYELLTGVHPFAQGDVAYHHIHTQPKPPRELRPDLPENLSAIVLKSIEKDHAKRFESALQMALALREVPVK